MPDHESPPSLISELCALARDQLKTQAARSTALEASSLGVMAFDGTFATIALTFGRTPLWIAVLTLLYASFALAIAILGLPAAQRTGPSIARAQRRRETAGDDWVTMHLLDWLEQDIRVNEQALRRKQPLSKLALIFLALAVTVELTGALS